MLGPLSFNGGQTPTHALLGGSPALDKGSATGTDQRGLPRQFDIVTIAPASGGNNSDIGAVEMQALIVNSNADPGDGVCDATCTLRDAISAANANGAGLDDILFDNTVFNTSQTINLLTALPDITKSVTINGPGANLLTVRRDYNAATNFRVFNIPNGGFNVALTGITISNGRASDYGGGIFSQSNLTLTNVHVTGNQATNNGGGVFCFNGTFNLNGSTVSGNTAGDAGLDGGGGLELRLGNATLTNSTISGNTANNTASGAGVVFVDEAGQVTSCTIANNITGTANTGGGILTIGAAGGTATTTLRNTIIANNSLPNLRTETLNGGTAVVTSLGFNLSDNYNGVVTPLATDKTGQPLLGPLSFIGGQTPAHALLAGSPALDAGDASGLATDQRGQPRVFGASADIGAVEMRPIVVTNTQDANAGSLRQAIIDANANGTGLDDILFSNTVFNTIADHQSADGFARHHEQRDAQRTGRESVDRAARFQCGDGLSHLQHCGRRDERGCHQRDDHHGRECR